MTGAVTIPNSVTSIFEGFLDATAFAKHTGITSVTIGNGVKKIGAYAFYGCTGLTSITIGNNVASIGAMAFENTRITSITIPASVTSIGINVFKDTSLTSVTFEGTIPYLEQGPFNDWGAGPLKSCFYATDYTNGTPGTYTRPNTSSFSWTKS